MGCCATVLRNSVAALGLLAVRQFSKLLCTLVAPKSVVETGRGSYGSVYQAQDKDTGETVAVKVIPLGDKDEVAEIQKEIAMLKECNHPNVVRYLVWTASHLSVHCMFTLLCRSSSVLLDF